MDLEELFWLVHSNQPPPPPGGGPQLSDAEFKELIALHERTMEQVNGR